MISDHHAESAGMVAAANPLCIGSSILPRCSRSFAAVRGLVKKVHLAEARPRPVRAYRAHDGRPVQRMLSAAYTRAPRTRGGPARCCSSENPRPVGMQARDEMGRSNARACMPGRAQASASTNRHVEVASSAPRRTAVGEAFRMRVVATGDYSLEASDPTAQRIPGAAGFKLVFHLPSRYGRQRHFGINKLMTRCCGCGPSIRVRYSKTLLRRKDCKELMLR